MSSYEARLMNMVDPDRGRAWDLNDDDRAAIRWAFDRIKTLEDDKERLSRERAEAWDGAYKQRQKIEAAIKTFSEAIK